MSYMLRAGAVDGARAVRPHPVPGLRGGARVLPRLPRGGHEPPAAVSLAMGVCICRSVKNCVSRYSCYQAMHSMQSTSAGSKTTLD